MGLAGEAKLKNRVQVLVEVDALGDVVLYELEVRVV